MQVAVGGTFEPVHAGHRKLLQRAFDLGNVTVGLTSDALATETRSEERPVRQYDDRKAALKTVLDKFAVEFDRGYVVRKLNQPTGIATEEEFDTLVVSPETKTGARRVNELRRERDIEPLEIEVVDHVYASDGKPISSTRIVRGEIDTEGNLISDVNSQIS